MSPITTLPPLPPEQARELLAQLTGCEEPTQALLLDDQGQLLGVTDSEVREVGE
jgi:hypothetical protein